MKKNSIVISVVALCCILIVGMSPMAFGQEYIGQNGLISPMYTSISDISASLAISDDTASCSAYVSTKTSCHISLEVRLQQKINGTWRTIKTWTVSDTDVTFLSISPSKSVGSGTFRVKATATVTNSGGSSETKSATSSTAFN